MFAIKNPEKCSNCKLSPVTSVFDKKAGDLICTNCGAVLQHKIASVSSFSYKYGENDLVGCGETVKVSHLGFSFTTQHESQKKMMKNRATRQKLTRLQNMISMNYKDERFKITISRMIEEFQMRMNLNRRVSKCANAIASQYYHLKSHPIRKTKIIAAVCVCLACRQLKSDRTYKEFEGTGLVKKKELGTYVKMFARLLKIKTQGAAPSRIINRYGSLFELTFRRKKKIRLLIEFVVKKNLAGGRCPHSIVCVCIYLAYRIYDPIRVKTLKEISLQMDIAVNTSTHCTLHLIEKADALKVLFTKKKHRTRFKQLCQEFRKRVS